MSACAHTNVSDLRFPFPTVILRHVANAPTHSLTHSLLNHFYTQTHSLKCILLLSSKKQKKEEKKKNAQEASVLIALRKYLPLILNGKWPFNNNNSFEWLKMGIHWQMAIQSNIIERKKVKRMRAPVCAYLYMNFYFFFFFAFSRLSFCT